MNKILWISILLSLLCFTSLYADELVMTNGKIVSGKVMKESDKTVIFQTKNNMVLTIQRSSVKEIRYTTDKTITPTPASSPTQTPTPTPTKKIELIATPTATPKPTPIPTKSVLQATPAANIQQSPIPAHIKPVATPPPAAVQAATNAAPAANATQNTPPPPPPSSVPGGYDAMLYGVVDDVSVSHDGTQWKKAAEQELLKVKDEIKTGMGKTKILLRSRGELRLPVNSHLQLAEMSSNGSQVTIKLIGGRVWNKVTPGGGAITYKVQTPDLVAGVRGTLFNVSIDLKDGKSRVAVFEGMVETISVKDATQKLQLNPDKFTIADNTGKLSTPAQVPADEINEWTEWDQWALDVHQNISSKFVFGGTAIDSMAKLAANDAKKYEAIVNEANANILATKEDDHLITLREAFVQYAKDTKQFPTTQQGFSVLVTDPGIPGWKGPYIKDKLPVKDRWGMEIKYELKKSPVGNIYGSIISAGPNRVYSNGLVDDLRQLVPYYQLKL